MKPFITLLYLAICLVANAQTDGDLIRFKDGKTSKGKQKALVYCTNAIQALQGNKDTLVESAKACSCILQAIEQSYTYAEYNKQQALYANIYELVANENSPAHEQALACVAQNKLVPNEIPVTGSYDYNNLETKAAYIANCEAEDKTTGYLAVNNIDPLAYCECMWEQMRTYNVTPGNFVLLTDANTELYNKVVTPCINKATKVSSKAASIMVGPASQSLPISKTLGTSRIKVGVSGIDKYFIVNTGMPETYISSSMENELLLSGVLQHSSYLPMVDGHRKVLLQNVKLGAYVINNVEAIISDDYNGWMYLGVNVLNVFSQWCVDNKTSELILQK